MKRLEAGLNIFCDTNIILRWLITDFDNHTLVYQTVQRLLDWQVELWISPQIIREYCGNDADLPCFTFTHLEW